LRTVFPCAACDAQAALDPYPLEGVAELVLADAAMPRAAAMAWMAQADRAGAAVWIPAALLPELARAGIRPQYLGGAPFYRFRGLRAGRPVSVNPRVGVPPSGGSRSRASAPSSACPRIHQGSTRFSCSPCARPPVANRVLSPLLALVALPAALPLLGLLALRVWLTDGRPVVFAQKRIGYRGRRFTIYKFRTMGHVRVRQARQVTDAGERLRRHGLDELPQLFNLLFGSMALIGPRPLPIDEHPRGNGLGAWMATREQVMPGLTGLYQVCPGRRGLGLAEMCVLDAYWIHNRSPQLNAWILLHTVVAMCRG
jgi:lipopolysaccharide/colanic/teichoic acid biosynthesis glycosyltransferase